MRRRRLAVHRAESRGKHTEFPASGRRPPEQRLGHRAAADVAGANEQNGFHPARGLTMNCEKRIVNLKSGARLAHDGEPFDQIHRARQYRVANLRLLQSGSTHRHGISITATVTAWLAD